MADEVTLEPIMVDEVDGNPKTLLDALDAIAIKHPEIIAELKKELAKNGIDFASDKRDALKREGAEKYNAFFDAVDAWDGLSEPPVLGG